MILWVRTYSNTILVILIFIFYYEQIYFPLEYLKNQYIEEGFRPHHFGEY